MKTFRTEHDSMGPVKVEEDRYWGAQTQRSLENFRIGDEKIPRPLICALLKIKKAAAIVNMENGKLDERRGKAIVAACDKLLKDVFKNQFPLSVWQTGSGTQTHMNVNEVIANYATEILADSFKDKKDIDPKDLVHPNDQVNMGQSSNDVFPTAIHVMTVMETYRSLVPALKKLREALNEKAHEFKDLIKIGRTHLQDATPLSLGQEFSAYVSMLDHNQIMIQTAASFSQELGIGGTAVGTGINTPKNFGPEVCKLLTEECGRRFFSAPNKFHALTSKDAEVFYSGALKALAANLMKMANDLRFLASGPRSGFGEINLPANEPGSSIMPGKVNPTQCEALTMVCVQVMSNDDGIGIAASQGNFELNVYMPLIAYSIYQSIRLLSDAMDSFADKCVKGITANKDKLQEYLDRSLMLVTALSPKIGYEKAAKIAKTAYEKNISLKEAAMELGYLTPEEFEALIDPHKMV